ncbi:MAG: hypothetical protein Q9195_003580 [Heterodermia aff. obscurata]
MDVKECLKAYTSLTLRAPEIPWYDVFANIKSSISGEMPITFDSKLLETAIQEIIEQQGLGQNAILRDEQKLACKVFVCTPSQEGIGFMIHKGYQSQVSMENTNELQVSKAAQETLAASQVGLAASSFLDLIKGGLDGQVSLDPATGAYIPMRYLWIEASDTWSDPLEVQIQCLVSIGAQGPVFTSLRGIISLARTLFRNAIGSKETASAYERDLSLLKDSDRYFHFNLKKCLDGIGLGNNGKFNSIISATRTVIRSEDVCARLTRCGTKLADKLYTQRPPTKHRVSTSSGEGEKVPGRFIDEQIFASQADKDQRSGKSSFVDVLGGLHIENGLPPKRKMHMESATDRVGIYKTTVNKKLIYLMDTPGYDDSKFSDANILTMVLNELAHLYESKHLLSGVFFIHDISQPRMTGIDRKNLYMLQQLCGIDSFQNIVLVTGNWIKRPSFEEHLVQTTRERDLKTRFWKNMTDRGAYVERHDGTAASAQRLITWLLDKPPTVLQSQREMVDMALSWDETSAGRAAGGLGFSPGKQDTVKFWQRFF